MKNLESKLFLLIAFFIGTWGALFHAMQTGLIALGLIYNIVKYKDDFVRNIKKYKYYVAIPVIYILYSAVHTLIIVTSGKYAGLKPGFGIFEKEFGFDGFVMTDWTSSGSFIGSAVCYFVEKFCQFAVIEAIFTLFLYQCPDFQFGHAFSSWRGELVYCSTDCRAKFVCQSFWGYQALFKW